jgi:hypothetical protein
MRTGSRPSASMRAKEHEMAKGSKRRLVFWGLSASLAVVGLYLAFAVFGVQTLFYDTEVREDFAAGAPVAEGQSSGASQSSGNDAKGEEADAPLRVSAGEFHAVAHPGSGEAAVYRLEDGSHALRLENVDVFNGPDLYVYAVAAGDANDSATVSGADTLNLGRLKGNEGDQTYALPDGFDPAKYRSVSIWCQRFSVNFATAPLA